MTVAEYRALIREVPDFPKPGILFYDITTLLKDGQAFSAIADDLVAYYGGQRVAKVVGIESRGFIYGAILAQRLKAGFVPVRKPGKLPADCFEVKYSLEYGSNSLAIHRDAIGMGERVLIVESSASISWSNSKNSRAGRSSLVTPYVLRSSIPRGL
jgi:adenine phosphoribosyltransferase